MNTSIPNSSSHTLLSSMLFVVLASLTIVGCEQRNSGKLENRIAELESQTKKQEKKIMLLASSVTRSRSSVFDPPLKQFFDAPEFWEVVYEDKGACHNACYQSYKQDLIACKGDNDCEFQAGLRTVECHQKCGSPF